MKTLERCPACHQDQLVVHCPSPTCTWKHCRNPRCDLMLDVPTKRGHVVDLANPPMRKRWMAA